MLGVERNKIDINVGRTQLYWVERNKIDINVGRTQLYWVESNKIDINVGRKHKGQRGPRLDLLEAKIAVFVRHIIPPLRDEMFSVNVRVALFVL